jgi:hypothetical protein
LITEDYTDNQPGIIARIYYVPSKNLIFEI